MKDNEIHILFEKLKAGDKDALEKIYYKYEKMVYSIAFSIIKNKENAEDIKQNVFIKIFKLDIEKLPTSYEISWLYQVTKNETINYMKKNKEHIDIDEIYNISFEDKELKNIIDKDFYNRIIEKLKPKDQEIVSLKVLGDRNFREISEMLKIPSGTVKWRYYKAINILKPLITNLCLFIISLSVTIKTTRSMKDEINKKEVSQHVEDINIENNVEEKENNNYNEEQCDSDRKSQESRTEAAIINEIKTDYKESLIAEDKNKDIKNTLVEDEISNTITEESVTINIEEKDIKNSNMIIENTLILITTSFLIITIILSVIFIKNQQKLKKKMSK